MFRRLVDSILFISFLFFSFSLAFAQETVPSYVELKSVVQFVPDQYHKDVLLALKDAWRNGNEIMRAIYNVDPLEKEGMAFLIANMPLKDLRILSSEFLIENVDLAYQSLNEVPWGKDIPKEIFFNNVLPYATINERRDNWRKDFHDRFIAIAKKSKGIDEAVTALNKYVFAMTGVTYNATKRPKPDQSPYESIKAHYASCTGLSVLLVDALRSVGIPARIAGISLWTDESGNHTWVEIWDGKWHHIGAGEPTELDHAWFTKKAASTDHQHRIYATSFKKTGIVFPMVWAKHNKNVYAVDVTDYYIDQIWNKN
jgi:hypothetical protein